MENEDEFENTIPICPECGRETIVDGGEEDYYNIWCTAEDDECDWFTEVDIPQQ